MVHHSMPFTMSAGFNAATHVTSYPADNAMCGSGSGGLKSGQPPLMLQAEDGSGERVLSAVPLPL